MIWTCRKFIVFKSPLHYRYQHCLIGLLLITFPCLLFFCEYSHQKHQKEDNEMWEEWVRLYKKTYAVQKQTNIEKFILDVWFYSHELQNGIQNTGVELPFSLCGKELYFCVTFAFRCSRRRLGNCTLRNQTENSLCIQWLGWKKKDYRRAFTCISSSRKGVHSWIMYVKICIYSYATRSTDIMYTA